MYERSEGCAGVAPSWRGIFQQVSLRRMAGVGGSQQESGRKVSLRCRSGVARAILRWRRVGGCVVVNF